MVILATLFVTLSAALHVLIFWMESVGWRRPAVWRRFNVADQAQADATAPLAFNQGFYNLFLAIGALVGVVLVGAGVHTVGLSVGLFAVGSMLAAAIVLATQGRKFVGPAMTQGILPLFALAFTVAAFWA